MVPSVNTAKAFEPTPNLAVGDGTLGFWAALWLIRAMPTGNSSGCRPPMPGHADHLSQWHGFHFSWTPESVVASVWVSGRHASESLEPFPGK